MQSVYRGATWWSESHWKRFDTLPPSLTLEEIRATTKSHFPTADLALLEAAGELVQKRHGHRTQGTTERCESRHVHAVARTVAELGQDPEAVAAAFLHDIVEEGGLSFTRLERDFGPRVARLVHAVTRPQEACPRHSEALAQRQLFSQVVRQATSNPVLFPAVFIKLGEHLDHLHFSAEHLPSRQASDMARQTIRGYAPLADRLGVSELSTALKDTAFQHWEPLKYAQVARQLEAQATDRIAFLLEVHDFLVKELQRMSIGATLEWRTKGVFSTYDKMQRTGRPLPQIHDLAGLRIIVDLDSDCFRVLNLLYGLGYLLDEEFDDYIRNPKRNGYRSLHVVVLCPTGTTFEAQIRSRVMHAEAQYGQAAHWRYSIERGGLYPSWRTFPQSPARRCGRRH